MSKFLDRIKESFSFDYRSLAIYRCLIGLIIIADVLYRLPDLTNFYTDIGLIPRSIFLSEMSMPWSFSLHLANGSTGFILLMFLIHLIFGVMLFFGYKTRWAVIGAYIMTVSVHNRNWLINNGGDDILRALLFISIFLPLNKRFSIDSALTRQKSDKEQQGHLSTWGLAFIFQVFAIYFVSYVLKDHAIWRKDFTALYYASRLDIFANPIGIWQRNFPGFQAVLTSFTIYLEMFGPFLLVLSFLFGRFWWHMRLIVIALFWALHFGIILSMWIGVFPYLCLVMWLIFLPGPFWKTRERKLQKKGFEKINIYFDGDCRFCEKAVLILREFFLLPNVPILPVQSDKSIHDAMNLNNSWVVTNSQGQMFFRFAAMIEVMKCSPLLRWLVPFVSIGFIFKMMDSGYSWIAGHRKILSQYSQFLEFKERKTSITWVKWIYQSAGAFLLMTLIAWNATTIKKWNFQAPFFQTVTRWVHLYQEWNMFAPYPKMDNIWVEIPATLSDGSEIELLTGDRDIFEVKDQKFPKVIPNEHWRKFYLNLSEKVDNARYYGGYLCRLWNERHLGTVKGVNLMKFEIIVYSQTNLENDLKGGLSRRLSWRHWCFDEEFKKDNEKVRK